LQAVILEVQRLFPVVPLGVPHGTTRPANLAGFRLPAGTMVMALHWDQFYKPPFRPETFL
jgi:cytochrome P450